MACREGCGYLSFGYSCGTKASFRYIHYAPISRGESIEARLFLRGILGGKAGGLLCSARVEGSLEDRELGELT